MPESYVFEDVVVPSSRPGSFQRIREPVCYRFEKGNESARGAGQFNRVRIRVATDIMKAAKIPIGCACVLQIDRAKRMACILRVDPTLANGRQTYAMGPALQGKAQGKRETLDGKFITGRVVFPLTREVEPLFWPDGNTAGRIDCSTDQVRARDGAILIRLPQPVSSEMDWPQ